MWILKSQLQLSLPHSVHQQPGSLQRLTNLIASTVLNLYDIQSNLFGPADVLLVGSAVGAIDGSLIVEDNILTFVATSGLLPADTYTVTLRSEDNGFKGSEFGQLLDGEYTGTFPSGDGTPGGDFVYTFTVAPPEPVVVSLPDFTRGPGQDVDVPLAELGGGGLPITIDDADGVTSGYMKIHYDPDLLTITAATPGLDAPEGTMVSANLDTPGEVTLAFFSPIPLWSGSAQIITLDAVVPAGAPYGEAHLLDITDLELNAGALPATDDDALHVVAFMGDANRNQRFDTEDPRLIWRVGMGLDSGFEQYPTIDPIIIADLTGDGTLSPLDCSHLMEEIVGGDSEYVPPMPVMENAEPTADDQEVSTDEDSAIVIQLTGDDGDPEVVQILTFATTDPANGTLSGFDPATGTVTYTPAPGFNGIDTFTFTVTDDALAGPVADLTSPAATVTIKVNPVNDRPTADPQSVDIPEDSSGVITLTGNDEDPEVTQVLTYVITTPRPSEP